MKNFVLWWYYSYYLGIPVGEDISNQRLEVSEKLCLLIGVYFDLEILLRLYFAKGSLTVRVAPGAWFVACLIGELSNLFNLEEIVIDISTNQTDEIKGDWSLTYNLPFGVLLRDGSHLTCLDFSKGRCFFVT